MARRPSDVNISTAKTDRVKAVVGVYPKSLSCVRVECGSLGLGLLTVVPANVMVVPAVAVLRSSVVPAGTAMPCSTMFVHVLRALATCEKVVQTQAPPELVGVAVVADVLAVVVTVFKVVVEAGF